MPWYTENFETAQWKYNPFETINTYAAGDKRIGERTDLEHAQTSGYNRDLDTGTNTDTTGHQESTGDGESHDTGHLQEAREDTSESNTKMEGKADGTTAGSSEENTQIRADGTNSETSENTGGSHTTESGSHNNTHRYSDTPQNDLGIEYNSLGEIIKAHITNASSDNDSDSKKSDTDTTNDTTLNGSSTSNSNTDTTGTTSGEHHDTNSATTDVTTTANSGVGQDTKADGTTHTEGTADTTENVRQTHDETENQSAHENHTTGTDFSHDDDWREHRVGHGESATYQNLVQQSRDLIIEYDKMIFEACADLFFQLY